MTSAATPQIPPRPGDPPPALTVGDLRFPSRFFWGAQTAATQVEGGTIDNDFTRWAETPGHISDGSKPNPGLDHWNRLEADYRHLAARGHNAHALTVAGARVEPQPEQWDLAALAHYRQEILIARRSAIEPMVTPLHFALPLWVADNGGITNPNAPELFARFVTKCAETFGDQVTWWNTLNE